MSFDLIILVEESSMKNVLDIILPKIISSSIRYICIEHQGKQDLAKSIPIKLKAFQYNPKTKFLIIHDQDSHDCQELKASLL